MDKSIKDLTSKSNLLVALLQDLDASDDLHAQLNEQDTKIQDALDDLEECKSQAQCLKWSSEVLLGLHVWHLYFQGSEGQFVYEKFPYVDKVCVVVLSMLCI